MLFIIICYYVILRSAQQTATIMMYNTNKVIMSRRLHCTRNDVQCHGTMTGSRARAEVHVHTCTRDIMDAELRMHAHGGRHSMCYVTYNSICDYFTRKYSTA